MLTLLGLLAADPIVLPCTPRSSGHLEVPVSLEGGPAVPFLVDSGAAVTVFSPEVWASAGGDPDQGLKVHAQGAGGKVSDVRLVTGVDLSLAGEAVRLGAAAVTPLPEDKDGPIQAILGRDVLRRYTVELDPAARELRLHGRSPALGEGWVTLPMKRTRGRLTTVTVHIGSTPVRAVIDLGAGGSVLNPLAAEAAGVTLNAATKVDLRGADNNDLGLVEAQVASVALGELVVTDLRVSSGGLPAFEVLRLDDEPAMVLGLDVLGGRHLVLDDRAKTLSIHK